MQVRLLHMDYFISFRGFELELTRLDSPESYFKSISVDLRRKRDHIAKVLLDVGMNPVIPEGGYFIMADWSSFGMRKYLAG